jgi:hypothetical protein
VCTPLCTHLSLTDGPLADFPDSRPAIEDLKYCLERTDQRQQLLVSLKAALETRLLHPGATIDWSFSPRGLNVVTSCGSVGLMSGLKSSFLRFWGCWGDFQLDPSLKGFKTCLA